MATRINSSSKGSSFEREVCKALSLWWTHDARDDVFWRTAGSGGRATNRAKRGKTTTGAYGDLTYTDAIGKPLLDLCCFEIKRGYGQWCILDIVDRRASAKPCKAEEFWCQTCDSVEQAGARYGVVIFKRDQKQICIMFNKKLLTAASGFLGPDRSPKITARIRADDIVIMSFINFLNYFTPETMRQI